MQAILLKRELGDINEALKICDTVLEGNLKSFYKIWLIKAQIHEELCQVEEARKTYEKALLVEKVRSERVVWLEAASFEER